MFDFLDAGILDVIDIFLVSVLFVLIYNILKNTAAIYIFLGIFFIYIIWKVVLFIRLDLLSEILGRFMSVGFITLVIVFQKEIRNFLKYIGSSNFNSKNKFYERLYRKKTYYFNFKEVIDAVYYMSSKKIGALIVIENRDSLNYLSDTGDRQDIKVSKSILESIFFPNSPLHDGAVLISRDRIISTRAILPISKKVDIDANYGMRHRAAIGITQELDCICIVCSEETGCVSYVEMGEIKKVEKKELENILMNKIK